MCYYSLTLFVLRSSSILSAPPGSSYIYIYIYIIHILELEIYSEADSGDFILSSSLYLRILFSMIILGIATIIKRTIVSLRFGKRLLNQFKSRMEKLLADIIIMNEIAILADQVEKVTSTSTTNNTNNDTTAATRSGATTPSTRKQQLLHDINDDNNNIVKKSKQLAAAADSKEEEYDIMKEVVNWAYDQQEEDIPADNIVHHLESKIDDEIDKDDNLLLLSNTTNEVSTNTTTTNDNTGIHDYDSINDNNPSMPFKCDTNSSSFMSPILDSWEDPVEAMNNKVCSEYSHFLT